jgi:hypothetical protein
MKGTESCEMCGMPSWAIASAGVRIKLRVRAENTFRRDRDRIVWCCSRSCAVQTFAVSRMGPGSHKWPVSLAEFASAHRQEIARATQGQSDRYETPSGTRINSGSEEGNFGFMTLPHMELQKGGS